MNLLQLSVGEAKQQLMSRQGVLVWFSLLFVSFYLILATMFGSSIQSYLTKNVEEMLGADAVIDGYQPLPIESVVSLSNMVSGVSESEIFALTFTHRDKWQEATLKVVDEQYPIHGEIQIASQLGGEDQSLSQGPARGEIWLDERLLVSLGMNVGEELILGSETLLVSGILLFEPDRLFEGHSVEMRAMVNRRSIVELPRPATTRYRYLMGGNDSEIEIVEQNPSLWQGANLLTRKGGQHPLAGLYIRVENFIGLSSVILFLLGSIASHFSLKPMLQSQKQRMAVMLSCGMTQMQSVRLALYQFLVSCAFVLALAFTLSSLAEGTLMKYSQGLFPNLQSQWRLRDIGLAVSLCVVLYLSQMLSFWYQLARVNVSQLLGKSTQSKGAKAIGAAIPAIGLSCLVWFYTDNTLLTSILAISLLVGAICLLLVSGSVFLIAQKLVPKRFVLADFALFLTSSRIWVKLPQVLGMGIALLLFQLSWFVSNDLNNAVEKATSRVNGDLFVSQATVDHVEALQAWTNETNSELLRVRPFQYVSFLSVNDVELSEHVTQTSDSFSGVQKPLRLSWQNDLPTNNQLTAGSWSAERDSENRYQISVESEIATDLNLNVGDVLKFSVIGNQLGSAQPQNTSTTAHSKAEIELLVAATHDVTAGDSPITFWFQLMLPSGDSKPDFVTNEMAMGSLNLSEQGWTGLTEFWQQHPTLKMVSLAEVTERNQNLSTLISVTIQGFALCVLVMSCLVMLSSTWYNAIEDKKRSGLMQSFGLSQSKLLIICGYEWAVKALVVVGGSFLAVQIAAELTYKQLFNMNYQLDVMFASTLFVGCISVITLMGLVFQRNTLRVKIRELFVS